MTPLREAAPCSGGLPPQLPRRLQLLENGKGTGKEHYPKEHPGQSQPQRTGHQGEGGSKNTRRSFKASELLPLLGAPPVP